MTAIQSVPRISPLRLLLIASLLTFSFLLSGQVQTAHAAGGVGSCQSLMVNSITLPADPTGQYSIYGELCNPVSGPSHTVQLLIHGATDSHLYWDWPNQPGHSNWSQLYSAVHFLTSAGYSTFNIDRIGVGMSSHPNSSLIDMNADASEIHQLVGRLRSGMIGGTSFTHVVLQGHSIGSAVAITEAATYHDVDGVVVTGFLQHFNLSSASVTNPIIPANQDPSGRFTNLDAGYFTTSPNTRGGAYYYAPPYFSDPAVIQYDEQTKETFSILEVIHLFANGTSILPTSMVTVPVLDIVGQQDTGSGFCGTGAVDCSSSNSVYQEEAPFYSAQAHLQVYTIPNTAHDLNLHYTAPATYGITVGWLLSHWYGSNQ